MTVYLYLMLWGSFWAFLSICFPKRDKLTHIAIKPNMLLAIIAILGLTIFAGLRSSGFDTDAYISFYNKTVPPNIFYIFNGASEWSRDTGFLVLATIIKMFISTDFHYFLFIIALITSVALFSVLYNWSFNYLFSIFLFFSSGLFSWYFNGMRQFLAAILIFTLIPLILRRKTFLFIVLVIIISTFHGSALILIPVYFIVQMKPWSRNVMLVFSGFIIGAFFLNRLLPAFFTLLENTQYGGYYKDVSESGAMGIFRLIIAAVTPVLAFIGRRVTEEKNDKLINICVNMSLLSLGFYILSLSGGRIFFGRMTVYFELYNLILLPWLLKNIFSSKSRIIIYSLCIGCYVFNFYYQMTVAWNSYYTSDVLGLFWVR